MLRILVFAMAVLTAAPAVAQSTATPDAIADSFFKTLQAGNAAKAYADMWQGTIMSKKQADVENVVSQTETALKAYGKIIGWEKVNAEQVSPSFTVVTFLLRTDNAPLFFKFQFYKGANGWLVGWLNMADNYSNLPK